MEKKMDNRFEYKIERDGNIANIELSGYLDANNAYGLMEDLKKLVGEPIEKIIFDVTDLEYIASAGLRAIVFSKQKIGYDTDVVLVNAKPNVRDVIIMSGLEKLFEMR